MAQRVNTKFLTYLLVGMVGLGALYLGAQKFLIHEHADTYVVRAQGKLALKPPDLAGAAQDFNTAIGLAPKAPNVVKIYLMLGNTLHAQFISDQTDKNKFLQTRGAFDRVLEIDPTSPDALVALKALIQLCQEANRGTDDQLYALTVDYSRRAAKVAEHLMDQAKAEYASNKSDANLAALQAIAADYAHLESLPAITTVQKALSNRLTTIKEIQGAIDELELLRKADVESVKSAYAESLKTDKDSAIPNANSEIPFDMAQAKILLARKLSPDKIDDKNPQPKEAIKQITDAVKIFQDIFAGQDGLPDQVSNAQMHYRYAKVLEMAAMENKSLSAKDKEDLLALAQKQIGSAIDILKMPGQDKNPLFVEIIMFGVEFYGRQDNIKGVPDYARSIALLDMLPPGLQKNFLLSIYMSQSPATRDQAVAKLEETIKSIDDNAGLTSDAKDHTRFRFVELLTELQLEKYRLAPAGSPARAKLHDDIANALTQMKKQRLSKPDESRVALSEARLMIADTDFVHAIQLLQELVSRNEAAAGDTRVLELLGKTYDYMDDSGKAIPIYSSLVKAFPDRLDYRKTLVRMLVAHEPDKAGVELDALEKLAPQDPDVIGARIDLLARDMARNKDQVRKYFDTLPESDENLVGIKVFRSLRLQYLDEAIRLLKILNQKQPDNLEYIKAMVKVYMQAGQKDKATDLLDASIKLYPNISELKGYRALLDATPDEIKAMEEKFNASKETTAQGQVRLAQEALAQGNTSGGEAHYQKAESLAAALPPGDRTLSFVWDQMLQFYLNTRNFDQAKIYVDKLAKINFDGINGESDQFRLAQAMGDKAAELRIGTKMTQEKPEFVQVWMALAEAEFDNGDYENASNQFSQALLKKPDSVPAFMGIVQCDYALQKNDAALQKINEGLQKVPNDPDLNKLLMMHQIRFGDPDKAIVAVVEALNKNKNDTQLWATYGQLLIKDAQNRASAGKHLGDAQFKEAQDLLDKARQKWPDDMALNVALADLYAVTRNNTEAEAVLLQWSQRAAWKDRPEPFEKLSIYSENIKRPDLAEQFMRKALENSNFRVDYQLLMSEILARHHKFDLAIQLLDAVEQNKDNPSIKRGSIVALNDASIYTTGLAKYLDSIGKHADADAKRQESQSRFDEAQQRLQAAISENPDKKLEFLEIWASILFDRGSYDLALKKANEALAVDPKSRKARLTRAQSEVVLSDPQACLTDLDVLRGTAKSPDPLLYKLRAQCYLQIGKPDDATGALNEALKLDPTDKATLLNVVNIYLSGQKIQFDNAMDVLNKAEATEQYKSDPDIFQAEASAFMKHGDIPSALDKSRKAMELSKGENQAIARAYYELLLKHGDNQQVLDESSQLPAEKKVWWVILDRGIAKNKLNDKAGALAEMTTALERTHQGGDFNGELSVIQVIASELGVDTAIEVLRPYTTPDQKGHNRSRVSLAMLLQQKGDKTECVTVMESALAEAGTMQDPQEKYNTYANAARLFLMIGTPDMVDKAVTAYKNALAVPGFDRSVVALNDLACVLVDYCTPSRAGEAVPYAQRAVDSMRLNGEVNNNIKETLAWAKVQSGNVSDGMDMLDVVIQTQPFPIAYLHIAEGYLKTGKPQVALQKAQLGLKMLNSPEPTKDAALLAKFNDLIGRCQAALPKATTVPN